MNEIRLSVPGSVRSKKNSKRIFACGRFKKVLPSKAYELWEKQARAELFGGGLPVYPPLTALVHVEAHFYYAGPQPDLSGCLESIGDCLEGVIWENDKQVESWDGSRLHHDKDNPRTELIIKWEST